MPPQSQALAVPQFYILVDGALLSPDMMSRLASAEVESRLDMPSMAVLTFFDGADPITSAFRIIDGTDFDIGKQITVKAKRDRDPMPVFTGEITAVEPDFNSEGIVTFRVEAVAKSHRLHRRFTTQSYANRKDSDIAKAIAGRNSLAAKVDATTTVHEHVSQVAQSDYDFLRQRARRNGYVFWVDDSTMYFKKPDAVLGDAGELKWGELLRWFRPRVTTTSQSTNVEVKGWDPKTKRELIGRSRPQTYWKAHNKTGPQLASAVGSSGTYLHTTTPVRTVDMADAIASGIATEMWSAVAEAEGRCLGVPELTPGKTVTLSNLGIRYSGKYLVSAARHIYSPSEGYITEFEVRGLRTESFAELVTGGAGVADTVVDRRWGGVVPAIVTNLGDNEYWGRVKLKFPWLASDYESNWARMAVPMAGGDRGLYFSPEVGDEVLVAFDQGDFNFPYVVGALWNGVEKPPHATAARKQGKVAERLFVSKSGHQLVFRDEAGKEAIEIIDRTGQNKITIDSTSGKMLIEATDAEYTFKNNLTLKAVNVKIEAKANIEMNASAAMTLKANANMTVQATGATSVKGTVVNIN